MTRKKIDLKDSTMDVLLKMGEGNPGALSVLTMMIDGDHLLDILGLDDMNIRGSQIWVGWKDHFFKNWKGEERPTEAEQMTAFIKAIHDRDPDMVNTINMECGRDGEMAVTHGASWEHTA